MRDTTRLLATLIIWGAFTIIIGIIGVALSLTKSTIDLTGAVMLLIILLALMALVSASMQAVWTAKIDGADQDDVARLAKAKRAGSRRVERLIEQLDDDEIYDLEALLLSQREDSAASHRNS
jgi:cobalamin biosynthesis protein CobD/CbiB